MPATRSRLSREERRALTRTELLEAAHALFARQGFEGTSIDQISEAAGYTRGAFYSNYPDKEALLLALMDRCFEADLQGLAQLGGDLARVSRGFGAAADVQEATQREAHLLKMEFWMCALRSPRVREAYAAHHARLRAAIGALIEAEYARQGRALPAPAEELAAVTVALRNGLDTQKLIEPAAIPAPLYALTLHLLLTGHPPTEA